MKKLYVSVLFFTILSLGSLFSQTPILAEDFEGGGAIWSQTGTATSNAWIINTCAGNGPSIAGTRAAYITRGGPNPGCGLTGDIQYAYDDAPTGSEFTIIHTTVNASCYENLQFTIDYKLVAEGFNGPPITVFDYGEVVYSLDGGTTWTSASTQFFNIPTWTTTTLNLPPALNNQTFEFGFLFQYDDVTVNQPPLAIDNIHLTGEDNTDPVVTCPSNQNGIVDGSCDFTVPDYTGLASATDNCTTPGNIVYSQSPSVGTVLNGAGTTTITIIAEDESGNTDQCTFDLILTDTEDPTISCPGDETISVDNNCDVILNDYTSSAVVGDNCSAALNILITQSPAPGNAVTGHLTTQTITLTAEDEAGNTNTCNFDVTAEDNTAPTVVCPGNTTENVDASCDFTIPNYIGSATINDNCDAFGNLTITQSPIAGTLISGDGTVQIVTIEATDLAGNTAQCTFEVTLEDNINPVITCPATQSQNVDLNCSYILNDYTGLAGVTDNCSVPANITVTQTPAPGTTMTGTSNGITLTATDENGNTASCIFQLQGNDITNPTITCPGNQNLNVDGSCNANLPDYTGAAVVLDNCSTPGNITVTQLPAPGTSLSGSGTTQLVTLTAEDEAGNTNTCNFVVTLGDNQGPTISCPLDFSVNANAGCQYSIQDYSSLVVASDNCTAPGNITFLQAPSVGTIITPGTQTVFVTAEDEAGNTNSCSFVITVEDNTAPTFTTCPSDQVENTNGTSNCEAALSDYTGLASVNDNCSNPFQVTITQSPAPGTIISGPTLITLTAEDLTGNTSTCQFNVTLNDVDDPTIVDCPSPQTENVNASCQFNIPDYTGLINATDNCSTFGNLTITQSPIPGTLITGPTSVTITVEDENGNTSNCSISVEVNDNTPPTIVSCAPSIAVNADNNCEFEMLDYTSFVSANDACGTVTISQSPSAGGMIPLGVNTITMTATDISGNTDQCTFEITVEDNVNPTISCPSDSTYCSTTVTYDAPVFSDNCSGSSLSQTDASGLTSGDVFPLGTTVQTYTVTDGEGNTASCSFNVTVVTPPSQADAGSDIEMCNEQDTTLQAQVPVDGNGTWVFLQGNGNIVDNTDPQSDINGVDFGVNTLIWEVNNNGCPPERDTLTITIHDLPSPAITADTIDVCGNATELIGNNPSIGTGTWSNILGSATFNDINDNNASVTDLFYGENQFVWSIVNGNCPPTRDTLVVNAFIAAPTANAGIDSAICDTIRRIELYANDPTPGEGLWTIQLGGGNIADSSFNASEFSSLSNGSIRLLWTITHPVCPTTSDAVNFNVAPCVPFEFEIPNGITPDGDGKNDTWVIPNLRFYYPNNIVKIYNRWGNLLFESNGYDTPWDGTNNGQALPMGSYTYTIDFNDGSTEPISGTVTIIR